MEIDPSKLSRVTLVDESSRVYEKFQLDVDLSLQDEGRTLKIFVKDSSDPTKKRNNTEFVASMAEMRRRIALGYTGKSRRNVWR